MLNDITPLILTRNEAPNIGRTLEKLNWALEILVVDSFSTDETKAICHKYPQVEFVQRTFDSFADQCNFGLDQTNTEWVLSLDADYVLTDELVAGLRTLKESPGVDGYSAGFTYCINGRPLRASLYPARTVLYRKTKARYRNEGHGHRVEIAGGVRPLNGRILHDDRKPLERWLTEQNRYTLREAEHLMSTPTARLNRADRIRRMIVLAPALVLFYTLLGKGLILDGWPGWYYVLQRTYAEILLSLRLLDVRLRPLPPKL